MLCLTVIYSRCNACLYYVKSRSYIYIHVKNVPLTLCSVFGENEIEIVNDEDEEEMSSSGDLNIPERKL